MKKLLLTIAMATILIACEPKREAVISSDNRIYHFDTVTIRGNKHELITTYINKGGAMTHSPECWCLKDTTDVSTD